METENNTVPVPASYSAMIELVGVRDLAAEEPSAYKRSMRQLFSAVRTAATAADESNPKTPISVCGFLDKCIASCDDLMVLLDFVITIRDHLMISSATDQSVFLRGVVLDTHCENYEDNGDDANELNQTNEHTDENSAGLFLAFNASPNNPTQIWRSKETTFGYHLKIEGVRLFGKLERFKGIGIFLDRKLESKLAKVSKIKTVENVFVIDSKQGRLRGFVDLKMNPDYLNEAVLDQLLLQLRHAKSRSSKMARLFVPLLVNWIQTMDVSEKAPDKAKESHPKFLDVALSRKSLEGLRGIVGYEAIIWALAERLLGRKSGNYEKGRRTEVLAKLQRAKWTADVMRIDRAGVDIPEEICSLRAQRLYRLEMTSGNAADREASPEDEQEAEG